MYSTYDIYNGQKEGRKSWLWLRCHNPFWSWTKETASTSIELEVSFNVYCVGDTTLFSLRVLFVDLSFVVKKNQAEGALA